MSSAFLNFTKATSNSERGISALYFVLGLFYGGLALFTIMNLITQASLMTGLPYIVYMIVLLSVTPLIILSYGFMFMRAWVQGAILGHLVVTALTAGVLMPLTDQTDLIVPTVVSSGIYVALLAVLYITRNHTGGSWYFWPPILIYTLSLGLAVTGRLLVM